jgi:hypothetical protein
MPRHEPLLSICTSRHPSLTSKPLFLFRFAGQRRIVSIDDQQDFGSEQRAYPRGQPRLFGLPWDACHFRMTPGRARNTFAPLAPFPADRFAQLTICAKLSVEFAACPG